MALHQVSTLLAMLRFYASKFIAISNALETWRRQAEHRAGLTQAGARSERSLGKRFIEELRGQLHMLGLRHSVKKADAALELCNDSHLRDLAALEMLAPTVQELQSRIYDELGDGYFLQLSAVEVSLFEATEPFGADTAAAFPLAVEDAEESAKCLGLGRYTASVFHLMRTMECAVQALSAKLAISNTDRVWGNLLSDINKKIEAMPKGNVRDDWSQALSLLYHVKQAWRNDVMHPKETYTEDQANEVFQAVRSFMRHLSRLI